MTNPFRKVSKFTAEMSQELKKAAWPSWSELRYSTGIVIIAILLLGAYVSIVDFSLYQVVSLCSSLVRPSGA